jgi:hypothetical protein
VGKELEYLPFSLDEIERKEAASTKADRGEYYGTVSIAIEPTLGQECS